MMGPSGVHKRGESIQGGDTHCGTSISSWFKCVNRSPNRQALTHSTLHSHPPPPRAAVLQASTSSLRLGRTPSSLWISSRAVCRSGSGLTSSSSPTTRTTTRTTTSTPSQSRSSLCARFVLRRGALQTATRPLRTRVTHQTSRTTCFTSDLSDHVFHIRFNFHVASMEPRGFCPPSSFRSHPSYPPPPLQDDLVCLPHKVSSSLGHLGPMVLCTKVSNQITLTDPVTLRSTSMDVSERRPSSSGF